LDGRITKKAYSLATVRIGRVKYRVELVVIDCLVEFQVGLVAVMVGVFPRPDLSVHAVTSVPDRVIVDESAPSNHSVSPEIPAFAGVRLTGPSAERVRLLALDIGLLPI
jgi:hypothetical protein